MTVSGCPSLAKIIETGQQLRKRIEANEVELLALADKKKQFEAELEAEQAVLDALNKIEVREAKPEDFADDFEYKRLMAKAEKLQEALANPDDQSSLLIEKKANLTTELQGIDRILARREQIEAGEKRIQELTARNRELADLVARYEGIRFDLERFIRKQAELLESKINALFTYIQFRLFKVNINGGIEDDCEPLVNGVPYSTGASNSERILDMLQKGLNVGKSQGYFIAYGKKLTWFTSYFGHICQAMAADPNIKDIFAEVVYQDDVFKYQIKAGKKIILDHQQEPDNIDIKKIKGCYATILYRDGSEVSEYMTLEQIRRSWSFGQTKRYRKRYRKRNT